MPPLRKIERVLTEKADDTFQALMDKARNFGDDVDEAFQRLLKKDYKPKPAPKPETEVVIVPGPPGTKEKTKDELGSSWRVLTFNDAMDCVRRVLEGSPGSPAAPRRETDAEKASRLAKSEAEVRKDREKAAVNFIEGITEMFQGADEKRQLKEIEALMKEKLLTQQNARTRQEVPRRSRLPA